MPLLNVVPHFASVDYQLKSIMHRITASHRIHQRSEWFSDLSGDFAARIDFFWTENGYKGKVTCRKWEGEKYTYSRKPVFLMNKGLSSRKAYKIACEYAKHLAGSVSHFH